jgi:23S rRNA A2030 N6-methylase RlmJ
MKWRRSVNMKTTLELPFIAVCQDYHHFDNVARLMEILFDVKAESVEIGYIDGYSAIIYEGKLPKAIRKALIDEAPDYELKTYTRLMKKAIKKSGLRVIDFCEVIYD